MVAWFEIPVIDMNRAKAFYEKVFDIEISLHEMEGLKMGWFPNKNETGIATGSLISAGEHYKPSQDGILVYFSCNDVANEIGRVATAGGKVVSDKTQISEEHGYMAYFIDSEGNRIALHSSQ
ncbi:VOC family protein [Aquimarina sp. 2201CG5-10]|uniref:VOC family protein n=1 Tax=Aquimarina callyspongiae TaxID=3098150 RepID=UPI002AB5C4EA|nr:VOC family protein [Aquimarina sp. 2201CG5-10]MDY8135337.1 VOC family protein [Aquimarina sp. 2201CG5-10]